MGIKHLTTRNRTMPELDTIYYPHRGFTHMHREYSYVMLYCWKEIFLKKRNTVLSERQFKMLTSTKPLNF